MKSRLRLSTIALLFSVLLVPGTLRAQDGAQQLEHALGPADIIMPHITDSKTLEYPCWKGWGEWSCEYTFGVHNVTVAGHTFDLGFTKHIFFMMLSAVVVLVLLGWASRSHVVHSRQAGRPKGFAAGLESVILYLRDEIFLPVLGGHGGSAFIPFCMTLFFFVLALNLFGLVPWGSTSTGNIAVTAMLAIVVFFVVEAAGMKKLGKSYLGTIIYWPHDQSFAMNAGLTLIMTPVEIVGKFTKPFALTIRLFANMISGHVIILALIGLIFMFGAKIAILPLAMALFIMLLEILVAFIQAFIFALLAAVFIGQIRTAHH